MKLDFLQLPSEDRKLYIEEAAGRRGLSPVILEKYFWVCWLLHVLFEATFRDAIVFKGGTSLSKVNGTGKRLSKSDLAMAELALLSVPGVEMSRVRRGNHDRATSAWMRMRIDRLRPLSHH